MASFAKMLDASLFLIINTVALFVFWIAGSPILDYLNVWISSFEFTNPTVIGMGHMLQPVFGWFGWLLVIIEVILFVRTYLVVVSRTDYITGEEDF